MFLPIDILSKEENKKYCHINLILFQAFLLIFPVSSSFVSWLFLPLGDERLFTQELLRYTFGKPTCREEVAYGN